MSRRFLATLSIHDSKPLQTTKRSAIMAWPGVSWMTLSSMERRTEYGTFRSEAPPRRRTSKNTRARWADSVEDERREGHESLFVYEGTILVRMGSSTHRSCESSVSPLGTFIVARPPWAVRVTRPRIRQNSSAYLSVLILTGSNICTNHQ